MACLEGPGRILIVGHNTGQKHVQDKVACDMRYPDRWHRGSGIGFAQFRRGGYPRKSDIIGTWPRRAMKTAYVRRICVGSGSRAASKARSRKKLDHLDPATWAPVVETLSVRCAGIRSCPERWGYGDLATQPSPCCVCSAGSPPLGTATSQAWLGKVPAGDCTYDGPASHNSFG